MEKDVDAFLPLLKGGTSHVAQIARDCFRYIAKFTYPFIAILFIGWGIWYTGYNYQKKNPCCHGREVSRCNFTPLH